MKPGGMLAEAPKMETKRFLALFIVSIQAGLLESRTLPAVIYVCASISI